MPSRDVRPYPTKADTSNEGDNTQKDQASGHRSSLDGDNRQNGEDRKDHQQDNVQSYSESPPGWPFQAVR
jgi:hypothetical protein